MFKPKKNINEIVLFLSLCVAFFLLCDKASEYDETIAFLICAIKYGVSSYANYMGRVLFGAYSLALVAHGGYHQCCAVVVDS